MMMATVRRSLNTAETSASPVRVKRSALMRSPFTVKYSRLQPVSASAERITVSPNLPSPVRDADTVPPVSGCLIVTEQTLSRAETWNHRTG